MYTRSAIRLIGSRDRFLGEVWGATSIAFSPCVQHGNLWRRQEWEIYAPTRVGQVLRCSARAADRYRRRDRDVVAQEMWVRDEAGHLIARSVHHQSFLAEQTSGEVTLRDPVSKEGARQGGAPSGEPLSGRSLTNPGLFLSFAEMSGIDLGCVADG